MAEERKDAILFCGDATAARKLIDLNPYKPTVAKQFLVDKAIDDAAFILERINARWPGEKKAVVANQPRGPVTHS
jgi:hypothetical protein